MSYIKCFGAIPSPKDVRDYKGVCVASADSFPEEFELEMTSVKNQGTVGSCVAHALASIIEHHNKKQENNATKMSPGFIYGNRRETDHNGVGLVVAQALRNVTRCGTVTERLFKYNVEVPEIQELVKEQIVNLISDAYPNKISSYCRLHDDAAIKAALLQKGPVLFAMNWFDDIKVIDGVLTTECISSDTHHCMIIYGWDNRGWKIQNSWGTGWGNQGRAILPFNIPRTETWGISDTFSEKMKNKQITELTAKITDLEQQLKDKESQLVLIEETLKLKNDEEYKNLFEQYKELESNYVDTIEQIDDYKAQIDILNNKLLNIEKPFNTQIGQVVAKVINFFIKIFSKK